MSGKGIQIMNIKTAHVSPAVLTEHKDTAELKIPTKKQVEAITLELSRELSNMKLEIMEGIAGVLARRNDSDKSLRSSVKLLSQSVENLASRLAAVERAVGSLQGVQHENRHSNA